MQLNKELKKSGLKVTHARVMILKLLQELDDRHITVEEVYKLLLEQGEDAALATIYRVLGQFEDAGIVSRHNFEGGKAVYELNNTEHHDHLVCMQCGHVEEFCDDEIEKRQKMIATKKGFTIQEHSLYIYAECNRNPCPNKV